MGSVYNFLYLFLVGGRIRDVNSDLADLWNPDPTIQFVSQNLRHNELKIRVLARKAYLVLPYKTFLLLKKMI